MGKIWLKLLNPSGNFNNWSTMLKLENHILANSATPLVDSTISCGEYTHCTRGIQQQKIHFQVNKNCKIGVILCILKTN